MISNAQSGTSIDEVARAIYRISTPVPPTVVPGGFTFNQYLLVDEAPLLFHTGPRKMLPLVKEAIARVMAVEKLRYVAFSHYEADECGSLNDFLALAPQAEPLCGHVAAMVTIDDVADRQARRLADGERLSLGTHEVTWFDTPHLPHAWECGFLAESSTSTLFCGDLFTQPGSDHPPLTQRDVLEPSEAFRQAMDYYSHTKNARQMIERLASTSPRVLACMHGAAWEGDGASLLRALAERLDPARGET
ncbi:MAG: MBL fold metallo-hydrolase [Acidobacteriota bacterium]